MSDSKKELIGYRQERARDTLEAAEILARHEKWNSAINRLYYAAMALLLSEGHHPVTHSGAKSNLSQYFVKSGRISKESGLMYSQLFSWRQKGDYDDLFDFDEAKVNPYFEPVANFIALVNKIIEEK